MAQVPLIQIISYFVIFLIGGRVGSESHDLSSPSERIWPNLRRPPLLRDYVPRNPAIIDYKLRVLVNKILHFYLHLQTFQVLLFFMSIFSIPCLVTFVATTQQSDYIQSYLQISSSVCQCVPLM